MTSQITLLVRKTAVDAKDLVKRRLTNTNTNGNTVAGASRPPSSNGRIGNYNIF